MILGIKYDVRCVRATSNKDGQPYFIPVLGKPHIDPPSLGPDGTMFHWHLDYRFMTEEEMVAFWTNRQAAPAIYVATTNLSLLTYQTQRREMLREFNKDIYISLARKSFERPYVGKKAECGKCPHQGMEITEGNSCLIDNGSRKIYVCPGHHLIFDQKLQVISSLELRK